MLGEWTRQLRVVVTRGPTNDVGMMTISIHRWAEEKIFAIYHYFTDGVWIFNNCWRVIKPIERIDLRDVAGKLYCDIAKFLIDGYEGNP